MGPRLDQGFFHPPSSAPIGAISVVQCMSGTKITSSANHKVARFDARVGEALEPLGDNPAVEALLSASELADQPQMRLLCAALMASGAVTSNGRLVRAGARMLLAHETATLTKDFIKKRVDRTRPRSANSLSERKVKVGNDTAKEQTSFPSGHSAGAVAVARAFSREYPEHRNAALFAASLVAVAQVPRSAHYLSDVGAGILLGVVTEAATNLAWQSSRALGGDAEQPEQLDAG